jgi:hypothetical protein
MRYPAQGGDDVQEATPRAGMTAAWLLTSPLGQRRRFRDVGVASAISPIAAVLLQGVNIRKGP